MHGTTIFGDFYLIVHEKTCFVEMYMGFNDTKSDESTASKKNADLYYDMKRVGIRIADLTVE